METRDSLKRFKFDYLELGNQNALDKLKVVIVANRLRRQRKKGNK